MAAARTVPATEREETYDQTVTDPAGGDQRPRPVERHVVCGNDAHSNRAGSARLVAEGNAVESGEIAPDLDRDQTYPLE
jgi:hypothetical protein